MYESWSHLVVAMAQRTLKIRRLVSTDVMQHRSVPQPPGVLRVVAMAILWGCGDPEPPQGGWGSPLRFIDVSTTWAYDTQGASLRLREDRLGNLGNSRLLDNMNTALGTSLALLLHCQMLIPEIGAVGRCPGRSSKLSTL